MVKEKKASKKPSSTGGPKQLQDAYILYMLEHDKKPVSVFRFCKSMGISEDMFYKSFSSFKAIDKAIWKDYATRTMERLNADVGYSKFTAREKVLAFYFTLLETLLENRSFVLLQLKKWKLPAVTPTFLKKFRHEFKKWAEEVIEEGKSTAEIARRPYLDKRYVSLLWVHFHFIIKFWSHDDSHAFEKTDEAVERSVNLAFDVIGIGLIDNALEFGKFLYQQRKF